MAFGDRELTELVCVGAVASDTIRVWVRAAASGTHALRIAPVDGDRTEIETSIEVRHDATDGTAAVTLEHDLDPDSQHRVTLMRDGVEVAEATFRTPPGSRDDAPKAWTFGVMSCHQPFDDRGCSTKQARSMLRAANQAFMQTEARFVLMMGDQAYADLPERYSLFDEDHFRTVAPAGRRNILECTSAEVRAIYHQRHRIFWGVEEFARLQSCHASWPMLDDHEVVDNFGTHPDHATEQWSALRVGALQAYQDYQGSRVRPANNGCTGPFDYGFTWGPAAIWGMDVRSRRRTADGVSHIYDDEQFEAMQRFLCQTGELPLLVVMCPIPFVYLEDRIANAATEFMGKGSDVHERWSHEQCVGERDRILGALVSHARAHPHQRLLLLGGDVHSGAAFQIEFEDGLVIHQLISSPITNQEGWLVRRTCERAAHATSTLSLPDGSCGKVSMLTPESGRPARNPFGGLNFGLVDVVDHGDEVGLRLRLLGHDGSGKAVTVYDSGELGHAAPTHPRLVGLAERLVPSGG